MILVEDLLKYSKEYRQSHLNLSEACIERGGISTHHRGILAQYLDTNIPEGRKLLCHACNNPICSNPRHLYWGTDKENLQDAKDAGTWKSFHQKVIDKNGIEEVSKARSERMIGNKIASGNSKPKTEEHKRKISESIKKKYDSGDYANLPGRKKKT